MPKGIYKRKPRSEKAKQIISNAIKLKWQDPIYRDKMIRNHKGMSGKKHTENWKKKMRGKEHWNWKGGINKSISGYVFIYQPNHPFTTKRGYVRRQRLVAERILKRYLSSEEIIHHINGIKNDDRPENLYLFPSQSKHCSYHQLKNKPKLISNIHHP